MGFCRSKPCALQAHVGMHGLYLNKQSALCADARARRFALVYSFSLRVLAQRKPTLLLALIFIGSPV